MKLDLRDTTFVIPYHRDSKDREENLQCVLKYMCENFDTKIIVIEEDKKSTHPIGMIAIYKFISQKIDGIFYRTKTINAGIKLVATPYFCILDTDVIIPPQQYHSAQAMLIVGSDVVYPYGGHFIDIDRSYIKDGIIKPAVSFAAESVGGAVLMKTAIYWEAGLENENIIGWGFEDAERYARLKTLGYKIDRVAGDCYHITHERGINSSNKNPYDAANGKEYERIKEMSHDELVRTTDEWKWCQR